MSCKGGRALEHDVWYLGLSDGETENSRVDPFKDWSRAEFAAELWYLWWSITTICFLS